MSFKKPIRNIFIATTMTGYKADRGYHIVNAIKLFLKLNNFEHWDIQILDSKSDKFLNVNLTFQLYQQASSHSIVFGPRGSWESYEFVRRFPEEQYSRGTNIFFVNQIVASPYFNNHYPSLSTFISSQDYFGNAFLLAQNKTGIPQRVHILKLKDVFYFDELANFIREDIKALGFELGTEIDITSDTPRSQVNDLLAQNQVDSKDWLIILDEGPQAYYKSRMNELFGTVMKFYIYGDIDFYSAIADDQRNVLRNSIQSLFWHPEVKYQNYGEWDNCQFVKSYREDYGKKPDFHAAYVYASLEVVKGLNGQSPFVKGTPADLKPIKTILGEITWNKKGIRDNVFPVLFFTDNKGNQELYVNKKQYEWCDGAGFRAQIPIVTFP